MNVFDYWIDNQNEDDSRWDTVWGISPANRGINENHNLKFHRYDADVSAVKGDLNSYLGARVVNQGIVQNTLGEDGYPRLSSANGGESLAYLFDPSVLQNGKASYTGATHLFQQDEDGYYFYNSADDWAMFDKNSRRFTASTLPGDASHDIDGANESTYYGFYPFGDDLKGVALIAEGDAAVVAFLRRRQYLVAQDAQGRLVAAVLPVGALESDDAGLPVCHFCLRTISRCLAVK